ncbi:M14 family zinc carboxypeptidase [Nocardiopsis lambiniae]|uniref:M14 family zinc carboxypeptidase n=1 Tax=Nocardiopsis lambiniae TaxID=3075539 RepID=A0ABU2M6N3_9ACTN|nr:M14 family zinc carboxypeptidase [Nocardiopsis sp. DSM 44743]MDT0328297.1 M14 family zinc carboxypeptidase [Nocardiopsis sp. DSM 44743]
MYPSPPAHRRAALTAVAVAVAAGVLAAPAPALADPAQREHGNGPERHDVAAAPFPAPAQTFAAPAPRAPGVDDTAPYPRQDALPVHPEDPADHSIKLGLTPYHELAPTLNDLMETSDRVSAEVIGTSTRGRDLYLVTVTEPENRARADRQRRMRELISDDPERADRDRTLPDRYKAPVLVNANIHGNEWEGTDASLRVIEELATSGNADTEEMLEGTRLYFVLTANPDGRVAGTRANAAGFDLNRDFVTVSQPETAAVRQVMIDTQPLVMVDQHGYVNGTLIEPCTPPHGQNYEYDIFIENTYENALRMEEAVLELGYTPEDDGVLPPQIPFRDSTDGWDDWPPVFTPMYAPYQGAVASATVEFPMRVNNADYGNLPEEELRRRAAINTDISAATIEATIDFARENREKLVGDQIEVFRRGAAGEEQVVPPEGWVPGFGPEDVYTTEFPRAYVLPGTDRATARLVDFLIANDVRVGRAEESFTVAGEDYPAGSHVVDMHQPKRGMANVLLEAGRDISDDVEAMYDISGWSHGFLWGAEVDPVQEAVTVATAPVTVAAPTGRVDAPGAAGWRLTVTDGSDAAALNEVLAAGAEVTWAEGGAVIAPEAADAVEGAADRHGSVFEAAAEPGGAVLEPVTVAVAGAADEVFTLDALGFDLVPVSTAVLNAGFDWSEVDVLYAGAGLTYTGLDADARAALDGFLASGGGLVGRGATGARLNDQAGLLAATRVAGRSDANGVVAVTAGEGVLTGTGGHAFVYSPGWFTGLGEGVQVEQAYGDDPLVAGHWRPAANGSGGPDAAAGRASVISGTAQGAPVVLFGTEPMFRHHPKGLFGQVAQSLYWASSTPEN